VKPIVALIAAVVFAQFLPSCEGQPRVVLGWVEEKYQEGSEYVLVVDRVPYTVPYHFWVSVKVGDKVRYDGWKWEIVRRAGEPSNIVPITILSPSPSPTP